MYQFVDDTMYIRRPNGVKLKCICREEHWYALVLYKRFLTPFRDGIWNRHLVSDGDRGSFPHDPETVGDRDPTVLLLISSHIAITVGILWCYVYDAWPITNGSLL